MEAMWVVGLETLLRTRPAFVIFYLRSKHMENIKETSVYDLIIIALITIASTFLTVAIIWGR